MADSLKHLESSLSRLDKKEKLSAVLDFIETSGDCELNLNDIDQLDKNFSMAFPLTSLAEKHGIKDEFLSACFSRAGASRRPSMVQINRLKCGNHDIGKGRQCSRASIKFCSSCRLVGYCSQSCQKEHWSVHKIGEYR